MAVLIVGSAQPRVGRSLIAAALAYRLAREGKPVTLARLAGDTSAAADAATFAALESVNAPDAPLSLEHANVIAGDLIIEAPPGNVGALASALSARVLVVAGLDAPALHVPPDALVGTI